jgi:hypothetical protein
VLAGTGFKLTDGQNLSDQLVETFQFSIDAAEFLGQLSRKALSGEAHRQPNSRKWRSQFMRDVPKQMLLAFNQAPNPLSHTIEIVRQPFELLAMGIGGIIPDTDIEISFRESTGEPA